MCTRIDRQRERERERERKKGGEKGTYVSSLKGMSAAYHILLVLISRSLIKNHSNCFNALANKDDVQLDDAKHLRSCDILSEIQRHYFASLFMGWPLVLRR